MSSTTRRLATMLAGMLLLGTFAATTGTPAGAVEPPIGTQGLNFNPALYPYCEFNGTNRSIRFMVDRIIALSPDPYYQDGDDEEQAPLYQPPTDAERADVRVGVRAVIRNNWTNAPQLLAQAGYAVCSGEIDDVNDGKYLVLIYHEAGLDATDTIGRPMLVLSPGTNLFTRPLSLLSGPHMRFEENVKKQILDALSFQPYWLRGAVLSGTHRCNRTAAAVTPIPGNGPCGTYRRSDMAHNTGTVFQEMHDVLHTEWPEDFLVQLHGMSADGISVSRGNDPDDGNAVHPDDPFTVVHAAGRARLLEVLPSGGDRGNLTSCTWYRNSDTGQAAQVRDEHCATQNVQRFELAQDGDVDRFIHIEQSPEIREHYGDYIRWATYPLYTHM